MKSISLNHCTKLEQLPNVGPAIAADLRRIGILQPRSPENVRIPACWTCSFPRSDSWVAPRPDRGGRILLSGSENSGIRLRKRETAKEHKNLFHHSPLPLGEGQGERDNLSGNSSHPNPLSVGEGT
jgi:hypothetical protein